MGARDKNDRKINFAISSGEVKSDCTVRGVGDGAEATVCKMSPIWHVTAVHGREPMKPPKKQSVIATPHTPQAILMPDQGMIPISRSMERRIHGDDLFVDTLGSEPSFDPSKATRVNARARGNMLTKNGARGADRRLAKIEPTVVSTVMSKVAQSGENSAPARTFCQ